jgi:hypothetical protein
MAAVRKALKELGYEEGKNLLFEYRWAGDGDERLASPFHQHLPQRAPVLSVAS